MLSCMVMTCLRSTVLLFRSFFFFFQAEDGIRDLVRSRGLGDVYKRQLRLVRVHREVLRRSGIAGQIRMFARTLVLTDPIAHVVRCLLYTSDAADERSSVDLGGRRIIKKKQKKHKNKRRCQSTKNKPKQHTNHEPTNPHPP